MPSLMRSLTIWPRTEKLRALKRARFFTKHEAVDIKTVPHSRDHARILIVISKKVGSAPIRNLIRRRIKAIFYENGLYKTEYDWILFIKPAAAHTSYQELHLLLTSVPTKMSSI